MREKNNTIDYEQENRFAITSMRFSVVRKVLYTFLHHKKGFTLLELMVVTGILAIAITGLLASFMNAYLLNQANNSKAIAVNDGQYVLEKLKNLSYENITSYTDSNFSNLNNETIYVTVSEASNVKTVIANVTWTERQQQRRFNITTRFAW